MAKAVYRREIDTLFIRLPGFGKLHIAHPLADDVYALCDAETQEVVGLQIESWERHLDNFRGMGSQTDARPQVSG